MNCPDCQTAAVRFRVPERYRTYLSGEAPGAAICPTCLAVTTDEDPPAARPDFSEIASAFPSDPEAGVPMAIAIGLLTSLALHRQEIAELFDAVEEAGADPMLVLDRLANAGSVDSKVDLRGRRRQLEQLLE
ncbi:MAG: DUF6276 family protein [Haloarculaceae archaeon]